MENVNKRAMKPWMYQYVELKSDLGNKMTDAQIAKHLDITPVGICLMKKAHPEIQDMILSNIKHQMSGIAAKAMQALYNRLPASDKCIQLALEISGVYTPKSEQINKYEGKDKDTIISEMKRKVSAIIGKNTYDSQKDKTEQSNQSEPNEKNNEI